ncbi:hypothetical protein DOY81_003598, partial [Sarcophaga bullata]
MDAFRDSSSSADSGTKGAFDSVGDFASFLLSAIDAFRDNSSSSFSLAATDTGREATDTGREATDSGREGSFDSADSGIEGAFDSVGDFSSLSLSAIDAFRDSSPASFSLAATDSGREGSFDSAAIDAFRDNSSSSFSLGATDTGREGSFDSAGDFSSFLLSSMDALRDSSSSTDSIIEGAFDSIATDSGREGSFDSVGDFSPEGAFDSVAIDTRRESSLDSEGSLTSAVSDIGDVLAGIGSMGMPPTKSSFVSEVFLALLIFSSGVTDDNSSSVLANCSSVLDLTISLAALIISWTSALTSVLIAACSSAEGVDTKLESVVPPLSSLDFFISAALGLAALTGLPGARLDGEAPRGRLDIGLRGSVALLSAAVVVIRLEVVVEVWRIVCCFDSKTLRLFASLVLLAGVLLGLALAAREIIFDLTSLVAGLDMSCLRGVAVGELFFSDKSFLTTLRSKDLGGLVSIRDLTKGLTSARGFSALAFAILAAGLIGSADSMISLAG